MADKLTLTVFLVPDLHSPIVGAGQEDLTLGIVPERIASNLVDWSVVTEVGLQVLS